MSNLFYEKIKSKILNVKYEKQILIGTVTQVNPLFVTLVPDDTPIPVISTAGLIGLKIGSRVLLNKLFNKYIAIAIIGNPALRLITMDAVYLTSTTMTDTDLVYSFEADSIYSVHLTLGANGSNNNGIKLDWAETGTIPSNQVRRTVGQAFGQTDRTNSNVTVQQSYLTSDIAYGCASSNSIQEFYKLVTTTAGTMTLRAAKQANTDSGTDTVISATSYATVLKIG